jgi:hypothetical protein
VLCLLPLNIIIAYIRQDDFTRKKYVTLNLFQGLASWIEAETSSA